MTAKVPTIHFDTADFPARERLDRWRATASAFEITQPDGVARESFWAQGDAWMLGDLVVTHTRLSETHFLRSAEMTKADGIDRYSFILLMEGTRTGNTEGRLLTAGAGQIVAFDLTRPLDSEGEGNSISVTIARRALNTAMRATPDLHGLVLGGTMGRLVVAHLLALVEELPDMNQDDAPAAAKGTIGLIASCLASDAQAREPANPSSARHLVKRYIEQNLTTGDLTPDRICRDLNLSRSALYRALQPSPGVAAYIRTRRLEAAHVLFKDPSETRGIATIAFNFGFLSEAHFSRAFRRQFGCSPRQARDGATYLAGAEAPQSEDATATFGRWMKAIS